MGAVVYVVTNHVYERQNLYKVGYAQDIEERIKAFNRASPFNFFSVLEIPIKDNETPRTKEANIHKLLKRYHFTREWFKLTSTAFALLKEKYSPSFEMWVDINYNQVRANGFEEIHYQDVLLRKLSKFNKTQKTLRGASYAPHMKIVQHHKDPYIKMKSFPWFWAEGDKINKIFKIRLKNTVQSLVIPEKNIFAKLMG